MLQMKFWAKFAQNLKNSSYSLLPLLTVFIIYSSPLEEVAHADTMWLVQEKKAAPTKGPLILKNGETIAISEVHYSGNKAIKTTQLNRISRSYLNRAISQIDLNEFQKRLTILYKSKGYNQVKVFIPANQPLAEGILQVEIKEGPKK